MRGVPELRAAASFTDHQPAVGTAAVATLGTLTDFVTNGTFAADSDWTKGTGWSIAAGVATHAAGSASTLYQTITVVVGGYYLVKYTISSRTAGTLGAAIGSTYGTLQTLNGTFAEVICAGAVGSTLVFGASTTFDGSLDNVTCYYLGEDQNTSGQHHVLRLIEYGYDATPTAGAGYLLVSDSAGTLFKVDVTTAGHQPLVFEDGLWRTADSPIVVVLAMGGEAITGKLNVKAY